MTSSLLPDRYSPARAHLFTPLFFEREFEAHSQPHHTILFLYSWYRHTTCSLSHISTNQSIALFVSHPRAISLFLSLFASLCRRSLCESVNKKKKENKNNHEVNDKTHTRGIDWLCNCVVHSICCCLYPTCHR